MTLANVFASGVDHSLCSNVEFHLPGNLGSTALRGLRRICDATRLVVWFILGLGLSGDVVCAARYAITELFTAGKQKVWAPNTRYIASRPSRDVSLNLSAEAPLHVIISLSDRYQPLVSGWYGSAIQSPKKL